MILKNPPQKIKSIVKKLEEKGFEAYLVGGCVRDMLLEKTPKDWDITTSALPEEITKIFTDSFYNNTFGTVGIKDKKNNAVYEVTTFRTEENYIDHRHPEKIKFTKTLEKDLERRDFTINAIALKIFPKKIIIDPFNGQSDLNKHLIRCVKNPQKRFKEDALRLIRAARFTSQLNFKLETETLRALKENSGLINKISKERIRDEFKKIILSDRPAQGIELLRKTGLLKHMLPELENTVGVKQNLHHKRTVYDHALQSLKKCPSKKISVRLAALFHDIAKPQSKRGKGPNSTFYNHEVIGARIAVNILNRFRFPQKIIKKIGLLIRNHMFYYEVGTVTPASVRRLLRKVKKENIKDLINLRIADRLGSDCPKAKPYKLRHFEYLIDKVSKDPISVKMLKINGNDLHKIIGVEKGPKMGAILNALLAKIIEDPQKNTKRFLLKESKALNKKELAEIENLGKEKIDKKKKKEEDALKNKHWIK